jgi:hypothetical protein
MKYLMWLLLGILLTGCNAGNGEGLNTQGRPLEQEPQVEPPPEHDVIQPTLASIQAQVFTPICAVLCHGGTNPAAGQDLSSIERSIASLINVDSSNALFKRVLPGNAEQSYLYLKITGDSRAGARMPLGQPALAEASILAIKKWIDQGALVDSANSVPFVVNRVNVSKQPKRLTFSIWFNQHSTVTRLSSQEIELTALYQDLQWSLPTNSWSLHIINDYSMNISLDLTQLAEQPIDKLFIKLNQANISSIFSTNGQWLDGDHNDTEGGVFSYEYQF